MNCYNVVLCVGACRSRGRGRTGDAPWCPALKRDCSPGIASPSSLSTLRGWSRTTLLPTGTNYTITSVLVLGRDVQAGCNSLFCDVVCWVLLFGISLFWSGVLQNLGSILKFDCL